MDLKNYADLYSPKAQKNNEENRKYKLINKHLKKGATVLDVGCAKASFYETRKSKEIDYYGLDYNRYMVDYCVKEKKLNCVQCDISKEKLPYDDNSFDFVYCSHVLEHILSNEQIFLFQEISRVLKKGGKLLLFTPTPYSWYFWDDPTHQRPSTHGSLIYLSKDSNLLPLECKYSNTRFFSQNMQKFLRLPPFRRFLREVFLIAQKNK